MPMKRNPYESKHMRGVRGSVPSQFDSIKIFDRQGESVTLFVGELEKGVYDFGYQVTLPDKTNLKKIPGVGSGWFESHHDANAYAAYAVKLAFGSRLSKPALDSITRHISQIMTPKLDLI